MSTPRTRITAAALLWIAAVPCTPLSGQSLPSTGVVHGFIREAETAEPIALAEILVDGIHRVWSDRDGYFTIPRLKRGEHRVQASALGYVALDTTVATSSTPLQLRLARAPVELAGITVEVPGAGDRPFRTPEVSVRTITPATVRRVPAALETDLFRAIQALPGVTAPSPFSSRMLVRGGAADQNLFLLDGYPVIHPYHLTGAFSAFHLDAVKDAEFWIAAPPARYGGRLSSVLDVALREGNRERRTGAASLGLVSTAGVVEGPHPRGAWFAGLRTTYLDLVTSAAGHEIPYRFYDAYAKTYTDLGPADRVSALVFLGKDGTWRAKTHGDHFDWQNEVYGLSWRHLFGGRAVYEQRVSLSRFTEKLDTGYSKLHAAGIRTDHRIALASAQGELRLDLSGRQQVEAGYAVERRSADHAIGYLEDDLEPKLIMERRSTADRRHLAAYLQNDITLADPLTARLGVRAEREKGTYSLQPRAAVKYLLSERFALSAGAGLLRQYDHLLQDPDANFDIYTADLWLTAGEEGITEANTAHAVVGAEARLGGSVRLRAETYSKWSSGLVTLAPFQTEAKRFAIERFERATGRDRGIDLFLGREGGGPVRGWAGYSLASSTRTVGDSVFAADLNPRHRFVAVWELEPWRKWGFTGRFEAFEGIPFTPAVEMVPRRRFDFALGRFSDHCMAIGTEYMYGARNSARTGWSKRLDLGAGQRWTDRRGWDWELSLSLLNALFDPTGVFRPATDKWQIGCDAPAKVTKEREVTLPPIPSVGIRVRF